MPWVERSRAGGKTRRTGPTGDFGQLAQYTTGRPTHEGGKRISARRFNGRKDVLELAKVRRPRPEDFRGRRASGCAWPDWHWPGRRVPRNSRWFVERISFPPPR